MEVRTERRGPPDPGSSEAELEELPGERVAPRRTAPIAAGPLAAGAAVVVLLAGGFGLLGGRDEPSPGPTTSADGQSGTPDGTVTAPPIGPAIVPLVTPWAPCAPVTGTPELVLQVNGRPYQARVDPPAEDDVPIPVPADVISEIWIDGGACAIEWSIDLVAVEQAFPTPEQLDVMRNPGGNPAHASQNRFRLFLHEWQGLHTVEARLMLEEHEIRATWLIDIVPMATPVAILDVGQPPGQADLATGCDVTMVLGAGGEPGSQLRLNPCDCDLEEAPQRAQAEPGTQLAFSIPGWDLESVLVVCGRLSGQSFIAAPEPACLIELDGPRGSARFLAPEREGAGTLYISTCASQTQSEGVGLNRLCGTWYAEIVVRA